MVRNQDYSTTAQTTKSALQGPQSAAPATKSGHHITQPCQGDSQQEHFQRQHQKQANRKIRARRGPPPHHVAAKSAHRRVTAPVSRASHKKSTLVCYTFSKGFNVTRSFVDNHPRSTHRVYASMFPFSSGTDSRKCTFNQDRAKPQATATSQTYFRRWEIPPPFMFDDSCTLLKFGNSHFRFRRQLQHIPQSEIALFLQFWALDIPFVRKRCAKTLKSTCSLRFWYLKRISRERVATDRLKSQYSHRF